MNYRSITEMACSIREGLSKLPDDVDLIVGIPRSGVLAGSMIALALNIKIIDVSSFVANIPLQHGQTRKSLFSNLILPSDAKHVLIVDDSVDSGGSLLKIKALIGKLDRVQKVTYCAIYASPAAINFVDVYFEIVAQPRVFEWNVMHRQSLLNCCLDIDGVLCLDPNNEENDDGKNYLSFLNNARRLVIPSYPVGHLVTSRLERYRSETELWLEKKGVVYRQLHMLDLPDAETRRRLGRHASFKAEVFRAQHEATLFIESERQQAIDIAKISGKAVLCFSTQQMFLPGYSYVSALAKTMNLSTRVINKVNRIWRQLG